MLKNHKNQVRSRRLLCSILLATLLWSCAAEDLEQPTSRDQQAPKVVEIFPEDGTSAVDVSVNLVVTFSEAIAFSSISGTQDGTCIGSIQLSSSNFLDCVIVSLSRSNSSRALTITPYGDLNFETTYVLKIANLQDLAGNSLTDEYHSSFVTASTPGLGDTSSARLRTRLELLKVLTSNQIEIILNAANEELVDDLEFSENPVFVLPRFLIGSLAGVGRLRLYGDDNLIIQVIHQILATHTALIREFEDKLVQNEQRNRNAQLQPVVENLLGILATVATDQLRKTGLSDTSLDEGLGEITRAMIETLDEAIASDQIQSAAQVIIRTTLRKVGKIQGMQPAEGIQAITRSSIEGLQYANLDTNTISTIIYQSLQTVVTTLDEIPEFNPNLTILIGDIAESGLIGLIVLAPNFKESDTEITQAIDSLIGGITFGLGDIFELDPELDLGLILGNLANRIGLVVGEHTEFPTDKYQILQQMWDGIDQIALQSQTYFDKQLVKEIVENRLSTALESSDSSVGGNVTGSGSGAGSGSLSGAGSGSGSGTVGGNATGSGSGTGSGSLSGAGSGSGGGSVGGNATGSGSGTVGVVLQTPPNPLDLFVF